jgi:nicotinamide mononucleotide adenylyltransferase
MDPNVIRNAIVKYQKAQEDLIPGGKSDDMSLEDIAKKHSVDIDLIKSEFEKGCKVELEHTKDPKKAAEIARDHLVEDPQYYTKLLAAGLEEKKIDELDLSKIVKNVFGQKKPSPPQIPHPDTAENLPDAPPIASTTSATDPLDSKNIVDQDPEWDNRVKQYLSDLISKSNFSNLQKQKIAKLYHDDPDSAFFIAKKLGGDLHALRNPIAGHEEDPEKERQRKLDKAIDYIHGHTDELWEESAEEFEEVEILDERKFEKVKMARNLLSKLGHPKAYERNEKGKYILRSKDIRKLMRKLNYEFDAAKGRWLLVSKKKKKKSDDGEAKISAPPQSAEKDDTPIAPRHTVLWVGNAQPWHKDHDEAIKFIQSSANAKIIIMLSKDLEEKTPVTPIGFTSRYELLKAIYQNKENISISDTPLPSTELVDIFAQASNQGITIDGIIVQENLVDVYKEKFNEFKSGIHKVEFEQKTKPGTPYPFKDNVIFVKDNVTNDMTAMTEEKARELAKVQDFNMWFKDVCPEDEIENTLVKTKYHETYIIIKGYNRLNDSLRRKLKTVFDEG